MKTLKQISKDLLNYFSGMKLSEEYTNNEDIMDIIRNANEEWDNIDPEIEGVAKGDNIIEQAASRILQILMNWSE